MGKIALKSYSCHRDSVSRAAADRRAYIVPKANSVVTGSCPTVLVRQLRFPLKNECVNGKDECVWDI